MTAPEELAALVERLRGSAAFWRKEGCHEDVARNIGDDITAEYARAANSTARLTEEAATALEALSAGGWRTMESAPRAIYIRFTADGRALERINDPEWPDEIFDILEAIGKIVPDAKAGFARMTGGVDVNFLVGAIKDAANRAPAAPALYDALEPFVRHGRAIGAYGEDPGPFSIMTDEGYRDVPAEDFRKARAALSLARGEQR